MKETTWWERLLGSKARPADSPREDTASLAEQVGRNWKRSGYFDRAEAVMDKQWERLVWPFIQGNDFSTVVDVAAGHGRNSDKLKALAKKIYVVDINVENVDFCRERFAGDDRFVFIQNDGTTLPGIPDESVTFVYCFDAMVHFDSDVVRAYLKEFRRILTAAGTGFCHHSNYTENPGGNLKDNPGWRNFMSEKLFAHYCAKEGLAVVKSQVIDWAVPKQDCFALFKRA